MDGIESAYGRGALGNLTNRSRRSNGTTGSPLSMTLDPFVWETGYEHRGGGAWLSRTPPLDVEGGVYEINGASSPDISPRGGSSTGVKNIMLLAKDKEALLEEAIRLKRALHETKFYLRKGRVHASTIEVENRKLEFDIKELEMQGSAPESARSPRGSIRTKLKGLKIRYEDMRSACDAQHEEMAALRRDVRVTTTQEMEMERDALLQEISRMQKDVKGLKAVQNALKCEHQDLCQIKRRADELEGFNSQLESCMGGVNRDLEKTNQDVITFRQKMIESSIEARKSAKKFKELEEHTAGLKRLLAEQRSERLCLDKELKGLELLLKKAEKRLASKGLKKPTSPKDKTKLDSPRKDQQGGKLDSPKLKAGKTMGASAKGNAAAAAAAAAAASAASFKAKNASAKLAAVPSRPASAHLEEKLGVTFRKQVSTAAGSRPTTPESFRKRTFKDGSTEYRVPSPESDVSSRKAATFKKQTLKPEGAAAVSKAAEKSGASLAAGRRPETADVIQKQSSKSARPKSADSTRSAESSRASSPASDAGKAEKDRGKSKEKEKEPGDQGGKRAKDVKDDTKGRMDVAKGSKGKAGDGGKDDTKGSKEKAGDKESPQAQKERQRLEKEMAAKMEKQQREMELAAKQREAEMAARLEKKQQEMELAAKQREVALAARQRELELLAKQREEEAAAKQRQLELVAKQREMALAASKSVKGKTEGKDEACQTSETAESYDELLQKMRKLENELASHRSRQSSRESSRESSPGPASPPPSRALTKKLTIKTDDKALDRKLTKKSTVKQPETTPRKSRVTPPKEAERKPELKKPESKKPEAKKPEPEPEPELEKKYSGRHMRRQILMADQDYAEDTKQITGPADAPRPRSVMFASSSFNILLSDSNTDPLIETQTPRK